jgi:hypothetical protein
MRDLRSVFALVPLASFSNSTNQGSAGLTQAGLTQVWSWTWRWYALVRKQEKAGSLIARDHQIRAVHVEKAGLIILAGESRRSVTSKLQRYYNNYIKN